MVWLVLYYDEDYNLDFLATQIYVSKQLALEQHFDPCLSMDEIEQLKKEGKLHTRWAIDEDGWCTNDFLGHTRLIELDYNDSNQIISMLFDKIQKDQLDKR